MKHQKVSKYYENNYLQNFRFLFISLSTAPLKTIILNLEYALFFKKPCQNKLQSLLVPNFDLREKITVVHSAVV